MGRAADPGVAQNIVPRPGTQVGGAVERADLDLSGTIISVNRAWSDFCQNNGGDPSSCGPGVSWTAICEAAGDDPWAIATLAAISVATRGLARVPLVITVPCHAPDAARWYDMTVSSRSDRDGEVIGARITLIRHRDRMPAAEPGGSPDEQSPHIPSSTVLAEVVQELLVDDSPRGPLQVLVDTAVRLTSADAGAIWTLTDPFSRNGASGGPQPSTGAPVDVVLEAASGRWASSSPSDVARVAGDTARHVLATCEPVTHHHPGADATDRSTLIGAPLLLAGDHLSAALVVSRTSDSQPLGEVELSTLTTLASHGGLALGVRMGERRRASGQALHDRERLAVELHEKVVRGLFRTGMDLERLASGTRDAEVRDQLLACADMLDEAISQLRNTVLRDDRPSEDDRGQAMT